MKSLVQLLIVVLLAGIGYAAWQHPEYILFFQEKETAQSFKRSARAVSIVARPVRKTDLATEITAVGTLQANNSVTITSKVTAIVSKLQFEDGQTVKAGTPLVYLDDTEARAALAESTAEFDNSVKLYNRAVKLFKTGNTPKAQVDLLLSEMQVAEAKVNADKARLGDYIIRAPFSGTVGFKDISIGALVRPADEITTLDDLARLKLDFNVPEVELANLQAGQAFRASAAAFPSQIFSGFVSTISPRVDPVTRVVRVRGVLENKTGTLKPGMFLSVTLETGVLPGALMVPEESVVLTASGHYLYVIEDNVAIRRDVTIGQRTRGWAQVLDGINPTAIVVIEGLQKLRDGRPVKVTLKDGADEARIPSGQVVQ